MEPVHGLLELHSLLEALADVERGRLRARPLERGADGLPYVEDGERHVPEVPHRRQVDGEAPLANPAAGLHARASRDSTVPIGILTYANIVVARPGFMRDAAEAGVDSLLIADIPAREADVFTRNMEQAGIEPVLIAAANTADETLASIARLSKPYTYCVSRAGITGNHAGGRFDSTLIDRVKRAGAPAPIFGFGISKPEHVRAALATGAKGVICGSAIVDLVSRREDVRNFVQSLKAVTRNDSVAE